MESEEAKRRFGLLAAGGLILYILATVWYWWPIETVQGTIIERKVVSTMANPKVLAFKVRAADGVEQYVGMTLRYQADYEALVLGARVEVTFDNSDSILIDVHTVRENNGGQISMHEVTGRSWWEIRSYRILPSDEEGGGNAASAS